MPLFGQLLFLRLVFKIDALLGAMISIKNTFILAAGQFLGTVAIIVPVIIGKRYRIATTYL